MKKVVITEAQYNLYKSQLDEAANDGKLVVNANTATKNNPNSSSMTPGQKVDAANTQMKNAGADTNKVTYTVDPQQGSGSTQTGLNCGIVVTKSAIEEAIRKALNENSRLYTVKDFLSR